MVLSRPLVAALSLGAALLAAPGALHAEPPLETPPTADPATDPGITPAPPEVPEAAAGALLIGDKNPWEPSIFSIPRARAGASEYFLWVRPEYRVRAIAIDPLELNGTNATDVSWIEQRLRMDMSIGKRGLGAIHVQMDMLDGVLFGNNGEFGREPEVTNGLGIATRQANLSGWRVALRDGGDPLSIDGYAPQLAPLDPIAINYAYGEVLLPFGLVRAGRMPVSEVGGVSLNDGASYRNRWGASFFHESVDRFVFGTKISELFNVLSKGPGYVPNVSLDEGVFLGLVYDLLVEDQITNAGDDLQGVSMQIDTRLKELGFLGDYDGPLRFVATFTYRWDERFDTDVFALPFRLSLDLPIVRLHTELTYIFGHTREISAGFAKLVGDPVTDQDLDILSARAIVDIPVDDFQFTLEWGYASGDADPRPTTPQTVASWPRDTNLGLLLFEHVLSYQSARSAAVGIENLQQLDADSFPLTEVATDGRVTNVNAFFPQVFWTPLEGLRFKLGALFAWSASEVTDPIQTLLALDGDSIDDDRLNYAGGKGGNYWGTEIDLGVEYRYRDFFELAVEAAMLFPGDALEDDNGDAVNSWLVETRLTFRL